MKPTKEEAEKFLKWLAEPDDREKAYAVLDEISEAVLTILHKHHILD